MRKIALQFSARVNTMKSRWMNKFALTKDKLLSEMANVLIISFLIHGLYVAQKHVYISVFYINTYVAHEMHII